MVFNLYLVGVGGQGIIMTARILGTAAVNEGVNVVISEIHGMAQRGGDVTTVVRFGEDAIAPMFEDGCADVILSFEPVEALRALPKANKNTIIICSKNKIIPFTVTIGKEEYPDMESIFTTLKKGTKSLYIIDMYEMAEKIGMKIVANIVMLGVLSAIGNLPISEESLKKAIESLLPPKMVEMNLKAFDLGVQKGKEISQSP